MIRKRDGKFRIALSDPALISDVSYLAVELTSCWHSTFKNWGKPADQIIVLAGNGKHYRVTVEEVK